MKLRRLHAAYADIAADAWTAEAWATVHEAGERLALPASWPRYVALWRDAPSGMLFCTAPFSGPTPPAEPLGLSSEEQKALVRLAAFARRSQTGAFIRQPVRGETVAAQALAEAAIVAIYNTRRHRPLYYREG